jgi:hypothetical protein
LKKQNNRKTLFLVSMALAGLLPYVIIWLIVRELFEAGGNGGESGQRIIPLAWRAVGADVERIPTVGSVDVKKGK